MSERAAVGAARSLLDAAVARRVFPAAVAEVGDSRAVLWREAFGRLTFDPDAAPAGVETQFDLASLTKPIATTSVTLQLLADRKLSLDTRVADYLSEWRGEDRERVTIQDLLEHASGLSARLVDRPPSTRREFEHDICAMPLESMPRARALYSDLGFILLGFIAADAGGATLSQQTAAILDRLSIGPGELPPEATLAFTPPFGLGRTAPTQPMEGDARRGRLLIGEVHDDYAAALGGVAGHSGLFGTGVAVGAFARRVLQAASGDVSVPTPLTPAWVMRAIRRSSVPGSSRGLGWDTMLPTSSCGTRLSAAAFGHVGFTGTSLWIDPDMDRYFVLLTNRACGGGTLDQIRAVRRGFHDALAEF